MIPPLIIVLLQVWALELELLVGISRVIDVRFPALARWGASRAWKRDLLRVHVHRERLNALSTDDVCTCRTLNFVSLIV